jgi:DNA repair protein RadA/Sms
MVEELQEKKGPSSKSQFPISGKSRVVKLSDVSNENKVTQRISTGSSEFDRVLGGGMVPGSVVLIAGEPGVGKSTLLTQLAMRVNGGLVLYVCGEESVDQVKLRIDRLDKANKNKNIDHLYFLPEMDVDLIVAEASNLKPGLTIIDSIQTLHTDDLAGMAGSVGQVRESTMRLIELSKRQGMTTFIVGHVTKEGTIAGPKVLEHMVDVVVQLTGDEDRQWRFAKTQKNRFGTTDEAGVFEMEERGMVDVLNPSGVFLEEIQSGVPGSAVVALMEGTRPILVEIQALVVESQLAMPRRVVNGIPLNKLQVLAAVLQKRCSLSLGTRDIFVNVAGGLKVDEPAADMAIALAIASSFANKPLSKGTVAIGEVGLLGEIRKVGMLKRRIDESKKQGFITVISPNEYKSINEVVRKALAK